MSSVFLKMTGIHKSFGGVPALEGVDFELYPGEVHALLGENGAGKSTLMKCLAGIYTVDSGKIVFEDQEIKIHSVQDSIRLGISFIHQELALAEQLTVAENIFMGCEPVKKSGLLDSRKMHEMADKLLKQVDAGFSTYVKARELGTAQKQLVEIAKALRIHSNIIVMDEPTAALSQREVESLFRLIRNLKRQRIAVIYISHRMEEIFEICDRITVLRDGKNVDTMNAVAIDQDILIQKMVGHKLIDYYAKTEHPQGDIVLKVEHLTRKDRRVEDVSFYLKKGEILGFSGIGGAGRTELMQALFGIAPFGEGKIEIDGRQIRISAPKDAMASGIGLVPEDRKLQGLILRHSVSFNITLGILGKFIHFPFVNLELEQELAEKYIHTLDIKADSGKQHVINLSGGNQQKVVLSKWLAISPSILILDEPTRGIDVGAKAEIYALMDQLVKNGVSIIMVSSEMPEVINMCDRVYVMRAGRIVACMEQKELDQEELLRCALGVKKDEE